MKKKLLILAILGMTFLFGCDGNSSNNNEYELIYELNSEENSYKIIGYQGNLSNELEIPETYNNLPVIEIGKEAFLSCENVENITLPTSIIKIEERAFSYCESLKNIEIKDGLKCIENNAFYGCKSLEKIDLPSSLETIGKSAFMLCESLKEIEIPQKITTLQSQVFSGCKSFTNISVPENIISLEDGCFLNCTKLKEISLSNNIESIGKNILSGCNNLEKISTPFLGNTIQDEQRLEYLFGEKRYISKKISEVNVSKIEHLSDRAFKDCDNLKKITLGEDLKSIDDFAFENCVSLQEIDTIANIIEVGEGIVNNCPKLTYNTYENGTYFGINNNPYLVLIKLNDKNVKEVIVNDQTVAINKDVFFNMNEVVKIKLSTNLGKVSSGLLSDCFNLKTLTIPFLGENKNDYLKGLSYVFSSDSNVYNTLENVCVSNSNVVNQDGFNGFLALKNVEYVLPIEKIYDRAFKDCSSLNKLELLEGLTSIGNEAFSNCVSLNNIILPEGLKTIGDNVFSNCQSLVEITLPESLTEVSNYMFADCTNLKEVKMPIGISRIGIFAFSNCVSLEKMPISQNTTIISFYAYNNCISLKEIIIEPYVFAINDNAFKGCEQVSQIKVSPHNKTFNSKNQCNAIIQTNNNKLILGCVNTIINENVESIGVGAFTDTKVESIYIPKNVKTIENDAFRSCNQLKEVIFEEESKLETIGSYAFSSCDNLENINIPKGIKKLSQGAFFACEKLKKVDVSMCEIEELESQIFKGCSGLESILLPETIKIIGSDIFNGCSSLKEITIPYGVEKIEKYAFSRCESLKQVIIPDSVTIIEEYAFNNNKSLEKIVLSSNIKEIKGNAFSGCKALVYNQFDNALYLGSKDNDYFMLVKAKNVDITSCNINNNCVYILEGAFNNCENMTNIIIPNSVNIISGKIFKYMEHIDVFVESEEEKEGFVDGWNDKHAVYFYRKQKPSEEGKYWYYQNNEIKIWE